jgi:uncharacterized membrane protein YedE/YeeE
VKKYILLLFGIAFGFILSRAGATTYDYYAKLFLFRDLQLLWVIATAAGIGVIGIFFFKAIKARSLFDGKPISFEGKGYLSAMLPGSLLFGLGWGLAGACPGTVLAMLGEGKLGALFTIFGIFVGTYLYGLRESGAAKSVKVKAELHPVKIKNQ